MYICMYDPPHIIYNFIILYTSVAVWAQGLYPALINLWFQSSACFGIIWFHPSHPPGPANPESP